jgi:hypothetical protein
MNTGVDILTIPGTFVVETLANNVYVPLWGFRVIRSLCFKTRSVTVDRTEQVYPHNVTYTNVACNAH